MTSVTLQEAQTRLEELIDQLKPGEELMILRQDRPVAKLIMAANVAPKREPPGFMKGTVLYMSPDFDAPLEDFKEYME